MKKCPSCYAIMRELTNPTLVPALQRKPIDGTPLGRIRGHVPLFSPYRR
jgi:hypothetical protein